MNSLYNHRTTLINKLILDQLQEINLIVIKLIKKNYNMEVDFPPEHYWYEVVVNSDGSLKLGFREDIMDGSIKHIKCENMKDFESVKTILNDRL